MASPEDQEPLLEKLVRLAIQTRTMAMTSEEFELVSNFPERVVGATDFDRHVILALVDQDMCPSWEFQSVQAAKDFVETAHALLRKKAF